MTAFKKMKMCINNPEHSKAVQEWLFGQGYFWITSKETKEVKNWNMDYIITFEDGHLNHGATHWHMYVDVEELDVQHLDPHLFTVHKSSQVSAQLYRAKPQQSSFDNMLKNLKHVQKAIEKADNKQSKRLKDRDKMMSKINEMLPEGFVVQVSGEGEAVKFDPEEIVEGSIWKYVVESGDYSYRDCTLNFDYRVTLDSYGNAHFEDDVGDRVGLAAADENYFRNHFKRIS